MLSTGEEIGRTLEWQKQLATQTAKLMTTNLKTQRAHPAQVALTWENDEQAAKKPPS